MSKELVDEFGEILLDSRPEALEAVEACLSRVLEEGDPHDIGRLLSTIAGRAISDEVMWLLIHAVESFEDEPYVRELISALPSLARQSRELGCILVMRVLNSPATRSVLVDRLHVVGDPTRRAAASLLEEIAGHRDAVGVIAKDLLIALK